MALNKNDTVFSRKHYEENISIYKMLSMGGELKQELFVISNECFMQSQEEMNVFHYSAVLTEPSLASPWVCVTHVFFNIESTSALLLDQTQVPRCFQL